MAVPSEVQLAQAREIALQVARRYLHADEYEAEDVAQLVLIGFMETDLDRLRDWRAWVARVARNKAIDHLRRREGFGQWSEVFNGSAPPLRLRQVGPSGDAIWPEVWRELTKTLTDTEREMLLASLDGASNAEVAAEFGYANANSAAVTLTRIRAKVRAAFADRGVVLDLLGVQRLY